MRQIKSETLELMKSFVKDRAPSSPRSEETYEIQVVTPMFGGGIESGENDVSKLFRETSIRGQLRFWFRATSGATCGTSNNLFQRESEIFGTTDASSSVDVRVSDVGETTTKSYSELCRNEDGTAGILGYALFPFEPNSSRRRREGSGRLSSFKLHISYAKKFDREIKIALWAWVNFGGIGARTRRGCGSLFCKNFAPCIEENDTIVWKLNFANKDFVLETLNNRNKREWSTLGGGAFIRRPSPVQAAWKEAIEDYKSFRQGIDFAREGTIDDPGLSKWPEADALRKITGFHSKGHAPCEDRPLNFPRAELGAPIMFRFADDGEPSDCDVIPHGWGRAGSPVIVKPLVLADGKNAAPCVVFLNGPRMPEVKINCKGKRGTNDDDRLIQKVVSRENADYEDSPLRTLDEKSGSALKGFKKYVKDMKGYEAIQ